MTSSTGEREKSCGGGWSIERRSMGGSFFYLCCLHSGIQEVMEQEIKTLRLLVAGSAALAKILSLATLFLSLSHGIEKRLHQFHITGDIPIDIIQGDHISP